MKRIHVTIEDRMTAGSEIDVRLPIAQDWMLEPLLGSIGALDHLKANGVMIDSLREAFNSTDDVVLVDLESKTHRIRITLEHQATPLVSQDAQSKQ